MSSMTASGLIGIAQCVIRPRRAVWARRVVEREDSGDISGV